MKSQSFTQWLTMAQELELSEYDTIQHDLQGTEKDSGAYEQSGTVGAQSIKNNL